MRAMRAIERSDIVLMVLNAEEGIREQDKRVAAMPMKQVAVLLSWSTNGIQSKRYKYNA